MRNIRFHLTNANRLLAATLLSTAMCHAGVMCAYETDTLKRVSTAYSVEGRSNLYITDADKPFSEEGAVDIKSEDAWVFFENVKPNDVVSKWSKNILIDGKPFDAGTNGRVAIYRHGAVVMAHDADFQPLTAYAEQDCKGKSEKFALNTFYTNAADEVVPEDLVEKLELDNSIRSFVLKRGYTATLATESDGMGYSRVFIADTADLTVNVMPDLLDKKTSFIRVRKWEMVSRKGWAGSIWKEMPEGLKYVTEQCDYTNSTWYYNWGSDPVATENPKRTYTNYNQEFVPEKWGAGGSGKSLYTLEDVSHLIGYNEPDHTEQSNVSVEKAIEEWPILQKTGLRLGSPATTDFNWLYSFMSEAKKRNYRVDYVVIHAYWGGLSGEEWYKKMKDVHDRTGRPIWIKEWNNGANWTKEGWPSGQDAQYAKQLRDLKNILAVMDTASFIERYSIYNWVEEKRSIISYNTAKLTPAGEYYAADQPDYFFTRDNEVIPEWEMRSTPVITNSGIGKDRILELNWTADNMEFIDRFLVEKSVDGTNFETVETVEGGVCKAAIPLGEYTDNECVLFRVTSQSAYGDARKSDNVRVCIPDKLADAPNSMEVIVPNQWSYILFPTEFKDKPVTVAGPLAYRNKMPLSMSITDVKTNSLAYKLQSWNYQQSPTIANPDTMTVVCVDAGNYNWGDIEVEAQHVEGVGTEWKQVKFKKAFKTRPAVFATQQSNHLQYASSVRVRNVTCEGFEVHLQYEEKANVDNASEDICYIAATPGKGRIGDADVCVGLSDEAVAGDNLSGGYTLEYGMTYDNVPLFLAAMQTETDSITSVLRVKSRTCSTAVVFKDREKSGGHIRVQPEQVGWMSVSRKNASTDVVSISEYTGNDLCYSVGLQKVWRRSGNTLDNAFVATISGNIIRRYTSTPAIYLSSFPSGTYIIKANDTDSIKVIK